MKQRITQALITGMFLFAVITPATAARSATLTLKCYIDRTALFTYDVVDKNFTSATSRDVTRITFGDIGEPAATIEAGGGLSALSRVDQVADISVTYEERLAEGTSRYTFYPLDDGTFLVTWNKAYSILSRQINTLTAIGICRVI